MFKTKYLILYVLTPLVIILDQFTKSLVLKNFHLHQSWPIVQGYFDLTYIQNTGAAFGLLAQANPAFRVPFFILVPMIALGVISYIFRKLPETDLKLAAALALVIGGAIGNLIDRVWLGFVVDFLLLHYQNRWYYPAFNVADAAICVGVALLMLDLFMQGKKEEAANAPATH